MSPIRLLFERQWLHALCLVVLLTGMMLVNNHEGVLDGQLWGITTSFWFWLAVGIAITHQIYVWFCWRTQLHASLITRTLGNHGFPLYAVGFAIIGISRIVIVFIVAISNQDTIPVNAVVLKILAVIALVPAVYLFYSVRRYFGFKRAFGIDHFDDSYRTIPFGRRGIFRFTRNGMYIFGFFLIWAPAFWWASSAALSVAAFNHLYIWVHYYATELPDMKRIYGETQSSEHN